MAKTFTLGVVSDADWIGIRANLTEDEYEQFLEDPDEFEDDRVYFVEYGNFRETTVEDEDGESTDLNEEIYDNSFDPFDEESYYDEENDSDDPVRKALCEKLAKDIEYQYKSIKKLAPNSVTILEKWHSYKEMDDFELDLEEDEDFDEEKLQFVIDNFVPNWLQECGKMTDNWLEDLFVEDRLAGMTLVYDGKILNPCNSEDMGADLVVRYAVRTDEEGNVVSVEELNID